MINVSSFQYSQRHFQVRTFEVRTLFQVLYSVQNEDQIQYQIKLRNKKNEPAQTKMFSTTCTANHRKTASKNVRLSKIC